jgi:hypothetical protein
MKAAQPPPAELSCPPPGHVARARSWVSAAHHDGVATSDGHARPPGLPATATENTLTPGRCRARSSIQLPAACSRDACARPASDQPPVRPSLLGPCRPRQRVSPRAAARTTRSGPIASAPQGSFRAPPAAGHRLRHCLEYHRSRVLAMADSAGARVVRITAGSPRGPARRSTHASCALRSVSPCAALARPAPLQSGPSDTSRSFGTRTGASSSRDVLRGVPRIAVGPVGHEYGDSYPAADLGPGVSANPEASSPRPSSPGPARTAVVECLGLAAPRAARLGYPPPQSPRSVRHRPISTVRRRSPSGRAPA